MPDKQIFLGSVVEVGNAYDMDTHARTRADEWFGAKGVVIELEGAFATLMLPDDTELNVNAGRLKVIR